MYSVQRVYVHSDIYESFLDQLIPRVKALKVGDPLDEATDVGPLIDRGAAERVETLFDEAKQGGAQVLVGGTRHDNLWQPTVLASLHAVSSFPRRQLCKIFALRQDPYHHCIADSSPRIARAAVRALFRRAREFLSTVHPGGHPKVFRNRRVAPRREYQSGRGADH